MNRKGYIKIMLALTKLVIVILIEAGKVPLSSAMKVGENLFQAATGKKIADAKNEE